MTEREEQIMQAAMRVFLRYGIKRATMNDIAQEAEVARQTLYNTFANKDEVVEAGIRHMAASAITEINQAIDDGQSLAQLIDLYFRKISIEPFELLHTNPNAEDIIDGINAVSKDALNQTTRDYVAAAMRFLNPYAPALSKAGKSAAEVAEFLHVGAYGAKKMARDRDHLDMVLNTMKTATLIMAGAADI